MGRGEKRELYSVMWAVFMVLAFAIGSIPFGLLLGRTRGVDVREHGSGNIGATNVARVIGPWMGLLVLLLDMLKGFIPTFVAGWWMDLVPGSIFSPARSGPEVWCWVGVMALAVLGHMYSPWVGFRGGKGVATGLGATLAVFPHLTLPAVAAVVLWIAVVAIWRYVSAASIAAALSLPVMVFLTGLILAAFKRHPAPAHAKMLPFYLGTGIVAVLVVLRHRANIRRLISGTESRLGQRSARPPAGSR